jgi:hypothetical protein
MHTKFLLKKLKGRDHMENLGINENIKMDLREIGCKGME